MDLKPGYKHTEAGVLPVEWEISPLGDQCVKIQDGTHFSPVIRGNDYRYVTSRNIGFGTLDVSKVDYIDAVQHKEIYSRCDVRYGDILLTKDGANTGNAALNNLDGEFSLLSSVAILRFDPQVNSAEYFLQQILSSQGQRRIKDAMTGNAITRLTLEKIRKLHFIVAPLVEQRAIATALSDVDALIASLDQLIAKKRDIKQAAMQELLSGRKRLPGFQGEWGVRTLEMLGEISGSGVDKKINANERTVRLVNYLDAYRRDFIYSVDLQHSVSAPPDQADRCSVKIGDVFFTPSSEVPNDIGISAVAMEDIPDAAYSYHVVRLRLREDWDLKYRAYAFKSSHFLDQAERMCEGSGVRYVLTQARFRKLTVLVPPSRNEQAAIGAILFDIDAELRMLEVRRNKTRALKQGMMQELLTGRTRLI